MFVVVRPAGDFMYRPPGPFSDFWKAGFHQYFIRFQNSCEHSNEEFICLDPAFTLFTQQFKSEYNNLLQKRQLQMEKEKKLKAKKERELKLLKNNKSKSSLTPKKEKKDAQSKKKVDSSKNSNEKKIDGKKNNEKKVDEKNAFKLIHQQMILYQCYQRQPHRISLQL